jgi:hypothetical protein
MVDAGMRNVRVGLTMGERQARAAYKALELLQLRGEPCSRQLDFAKAMYQLRRAWQRAESLRERLEGYEREALNRCKPGQSAG